LTAMQAMTTARRAMASKQRSESTMRASLLEE
jgi:hypothetical protein